MPPFSRFIVLAFLLIATGVAGARAEAPKVVVSIAPLHSLVSGVMAGVGVPYLLVRGAASPHAHALKPSDARALSAARLVFWIGAELEQFLERPLKALAGGAETIAMIDAPGLERLAYRKDGLFAAQGGVHGHEGHGHGRTDMHVWLDPENAKAMVRHIAQALGRADPGNAGLYRANTGKLLARLERLDAELETTIAPLRGKPFVVFHDSYQYFEKRYGVSATGSLASNPELPPGAAHLKAVRKAIGDKGGACAFTEPQFDEARVKALVTGSDIRIGVLDPLGSALEPGPELYFSLMRALAENLATCLSGTG